MWLCRTQTVDLLDTYQYPQSNGEFERPPFCILVKSINLDTGGKCKIILLLQSQVCLTLTFFCCLSCSLYPSFIFSFLFHMTLFRLARVLFGWNSHQANWCWCRAKLSWWCLSSGCKCFQNREWYGAGRFQCWLQLRLPNQVSVTRPCDRHVHHLVDWQWLGYYYREFRLLLWQVQHIHVCVHLPVKENYLT